MIVPTVRGSISCSGKDVVLAASDDFAAGGPGKSHVSYKVSQTCSSRGTSMAPVHDTIHGVIFISLSSSLSSPSSAFIPCTLTIAIEAVGGSRRYSLCFLEVRAMSILPSSLLSYVQKAPEPRGTYWCLAGNR